jgi:hypothetical protein
MIRQVRDALPAQPPISDSSSVRSIATRAADDSGNTMNAAVVSVDKNQRCRTRLGFSGGRSRPCAAGMGNALGKWVMSRAILPSVLAFLALVQTASPALGADDPTRSTFSIDVGIVGGAEPTHGSLPDETAALYGGDLRLHLGAVSLGVRLEKTAGFSSTAIDGFTRLLGTLGFNIGLGERTVLSPYLGLGSTHIDYKPPSTGHPDQTTARIGLELDYFLARYFSIGGGLAFDVRVYGADGYQANAALSGVLRLSAHLPFG